jgi:hypothetical protein
MAQVLVSGIPGMDTQCLQSENLITIRDVKEKLKERLPMLENTNFRLLKQSNFLGDDSLLKDLYCKYFPLQLSFLVPCKGGKGGFGSVLKSQGKRLAQKKSTNFESCRDLAGRRIKTVNEAKLYHFLTKFGKLY